MSESMNEEQVVEQEKTLFVLWGGESFLDVGGRCSHFLLWYIFFLPIISELFVKL